MIPPTVDRTIAVTGVNATDNPAPGVPVARALRHEPAFTGRIIGLGYDPLGPGFYAGGLFDGGAILPYPSAGADAYFERLREAAGTFAIDVLVPTLDSELRLVAKLEPDLAAIGIRTFIPNLVAIDRVSKPQLSCLADDAVTTYRGLSGDYPSELDYKTGLGWALLKLARTAGARPLFEAVLAVSPDNFYAREGLAAK